MRHVLTYDEQSLLDLANVDPARFKEVIRVMIRNLPSVDLGMDLGTNGPTKEESLQQDKENQTLKQPTVFYRYNSFRPLNDNELHILWAKGGITYFESDRGTRPDSIPWDDLRVSYEELSGGFTVCLILLSNPATSDHSISLPTSFLWRGVSRRSYRDRPNRIKGEALAFIRAITESRPVEIG